VAMSVTILAVSEDHRPLDDTRGRPAPPVGKQAIIDAIGHLQDLGVTWTSVPTPASRSLTEHLDGLRWVADEIMPAFR
jgi:hypothetical protein